MGTVSYTVLDGEIISENRNGVERDYMPDPQGNTLALLDNTQTKTDTFSYWPYGEVKTRTGTTPTPFQSIGTRGYYQDSSTKTYVRARYLDTQKGRWLTVDPIGFDGGNSNLYCYVDNRPTYDIDPNGTDATAIWPVIGGGLTIVIPECVPPIAVGIGLGCLIICLWPTAPTKPDPFIDYHKYLEPRTPWIMPRIRVRPKERNWPYKDVDRPKRDRGRGKSEPKPLPKPTLGDRITRWCVAHPRLCNCARECAASCYDPLSADCRVCIVGCFFPGFITPPGGL